MADPKQDDGWELVDDQTGGQTGGGQTSANQWELADETKPGVVPIESMSHKYGITNPWLGKPLDFVEEAGAGLVHTAHGLSKMASHVVPSLPTIPDVQVTDSMAKGWGKTAEQALEWLPVTGAANIAEKGGVALASKLPQLKGVATTAARAIGQGVPAAILGGAQGDGSANAMSWSGVPAAVTAAFMPPLVKGVTNLLGATTGVGSNVVRRALTASRDLVDAMEGRISESDILSNARDALANAVKQRGAAYESALARISQNTQPLYGALADTKRELFDTLQRHGVTVNWVRPPNSTGLQPQFNFQNSGVLRGAQQTFQHIIDDVWNWSDATPLGIDRLKRNLAGYYQAAATGQPSMQAATRLGNEFSDHMADHVRQILTNRVPGYQKMTQAYAVASKQLRNLGDLSLGAVNDGTAMRKLMTALHQRNEYRAQLLNLLNQYAPIGMDLPGQIAGHALSKGWARGIAGPLNALGLGALTSGGAILHGTPPLKSLLGFAASVVSGSPYLVGQGARLAGKVLPFAPAAAGYMGSDSASDAGNKIKDLVIDPNWHPDTSTTYDSVGTPGIQPDTPGHARGGKVHYDDGGSVFDDDEDGTLRRIALRTPTRQMVIASLKPKSTTDGMIQLGDQPGQFHEVPPQAAASVKSAPTPPHFEDPVAGYLGKSAEEMRSGWNRIWGPSADAPWEASDTLANDPAWWENKARGVNELVRGSSPFLAPLMIPAAAAAPVPAAIGLAAGVGGSAAGEHLAKDAGVPPEQAALFGNVAGLGTGMLAPHVAPDVAGIAMEAPGAVQDWVNQLNYSGLNPERGAFSRIPYVTNAAGEKVRGTMGGPKGKTYEPLPGDVQKLAQRLQPDNPEAGVREATANLKWRNWDKPAAEKQFGPLVRSSPSDTKLEKLQNVPERVQQRIQEAQDFLALPTENWVPKDYGIFDRSLIKQSMGGFPDVKQTAFPRTQPKRADLSYVDEIYGDPTNRDLIKQMIRRGLGLGGETFYPSLYPVKAEAIARNLRSDYFPQTGGELFDHWVHSVAPGSARNSILNERAVGNFLRNLKARGIPLTEENVTAEMARFKRDYGSGLPLMPVHREGAAKVLEHGISPLDVLRNNETDSYKIPTYAAQQTGNFANSWTGDVHEAAGETLGSRYHPYFKTQGGFGKNEYGRAEQHMLDIAKEMGLPGGTAQAGRWFGGGELTGLMSPMGDSLDMLETQAAYTLHRMGQPTDPKSVQNYIMKLIQEGGTMLPWQRDAPMPDFRQYAPGSAGRNR